MKKQVIDPDKIARIFGMPWRHPQVDIHERGNYKSLKSIYEFLLRETIEATSRMCLIYSLSQPDGVRLETESSSYRSKIVLRDIETVIYEPQYRAVTFKSAPGKNASMFKIWWRGQYDLFIG
jgi:hypothetical protein